MSYEKKPASAVKSNTPPRRHTGSTTFDPQTMPASLREPARDVSKAKTERAK